MGQTTVYVPEASRECLINFLNSATLVDGAGLMSDDRCKVIGVVPGDYIKIGKYLLQVLAAHHVMPSVGYVVFEDRKRRDPVTGSDFVARFPLMALIGDSTTEAITTETAQAQTLVIECTFVAGNEKDLAAKHGHTHLDDLVQLMQHRQELFVGNDNIVIKHQSLRHDMNSFRQQVLSAVPESFKPRIRFMTAWYP